MKTTSLHKKTHKLMCVYGEMKCAKIEGDETTKAWLKRVEEGLKRLTEDEQATFERLYFDHMTQEETAEDLYIDTSTVSRRRKRILEFMSMYLFPDEYLKQIIGGNDSE